MAFPPHGKSLVSAFAAGVIATTELMIKAVIADIFLTKKACALSVTFLVGVGLTLDIHYPTTIVTTDPLATDDITPGTT